MDMKNKVSLKKLNQKLREQREKRFKDKNMMTVYIVYRVSPDIVHKFDNVVIINRDKDLLSIITENEPAQFQEFRFYSLLSVQVN